MGRRYRNQAHGQYCGCQTCYLKAVRRRQGEVEVNENFTGDWDDLPGSYEYRKARANRRYTDPSYIRRGF